ncbi:MAG: PadR family transcriptional regulator [Actinobacteria bacterium]|nr:PadR family transcriptional regulator [Actinomycetota bacterium]
MSSTEAAVLGLLTRGARSGYDLNKLAKAGVAYVWAPAKSQIYAVLPRLVAAGYATTRSVPGGQRPDKQLYRLTAKGRRALKEWLELPVDDADAARNPFLLKAFFGDLMEPEALVGHFERRRDRARASLAEFKAIEDEIAGREDSYYGYLTLRWGLAEARTLIRWTDEVLRELAERGPST